MSKDLNLRRMVMALFKNDLLIFYNQDCLDAIQEAVAENKKETNIVVYTTKIKTSKLSSQELLSCFETFEKFLNKIPTNTMFTRCTAHVTKTGVVVSDVVIESRYLLYLYRDGDFALLDFDESNW